MTSPPTCWVGESGRAQLRIGLLKLTQLTHQRVVLGVGYHRGVEHVVAVVLVSDLLGEIGMPVLGLVVGLRDHRGLAVSKRGFVLTSSAESLT